MTILMSVSLLLIGVSFGFVIASILSKSDTDANQGSLGPVVPAGAIEDPTTGKRARVRGD